MPTVGEFWVSFHIFFWFVLLPSSLAAKDGGITELMFTTKSECNTQANKQSTNFVSELCRGFVWKHWYADEGAWQMATTPFSSIQPVPPLTPPFPVCWPPSVWTDSNPTGISQVLFSPSTRQTKQSQGLCREESIEVMRVSHEVGWGVEYSSRIMCVDQSQPAGQGNKWGNNCLFRWGGGVLATLMKHFEN